VVTQEEEERAREGRGVSPLSPAGLKPAAGCSCAFAIWVQHCQANRRIGGVKPMVIDFDKEQQHRRAVGLITARTTFSECGGLGRT